MNTVGREPFLDWFNTLDKAAKNRIRTRLDRLELGNYGDYESVGGDVYELRSFFGPGYRIYFGESGNTIFLLYGGIKATQSRDIKKAKEYWRQYHEQI